MLATAFIIPCFNEAGRLNRAELLRLAHTPKMRLLFIDDGSSDGTLRELSDLAAQLPKRIAVSALSINRGKGEAVRAGLRQALEDGAEAVGYLDADLATPVNEALRLRDELQARELDAVTGARVSLVGTQINRHALRHYTGRVFATCASLILQTPFYDTQCGAKLFRDTAALRIALESPFVSRWAFDVELLGRLLSGPAPLDISRLAEIPLQHWTDISGSKLSVAGKLRTFFELARIDRDLRARRKVAK